MGLVADEKFINFSKSYLSWITKAEQSFGRFSIESSCRIENLQSGEAETFCLATGVMAGNMYQDDNLVKVPPYLFQIAASEKYYHIFRDYPIWDGDCDSSGRNHEMFSNISIHQEAMAARKLVTLSEITLLARAGMILNGNLHFVSDGYRFALEFPIEHINIQEGNDNFQVETGPLLVPECSLLGFEYHDRHDPIGLGTAYIFFNHLDRAEFAIKAVSGTGRFRSRFYSAIKQVAVNILLLAPADS